MNVNHEQLRVYTIDLRSNTDFSAYPSIDSHKFLNGPEDPPCYREQAIRQHYPQFGDGTLTKGFRSGRCVQENGVTHLSLLVIGTFLLEESLKGCEDITSIRPIVPGSLFPGSYFLYYVVESGIRPVRGTVAREILSFCADKIIEGELEQYLFEPVSQRLQMRLDDNAGEANWMFSHLEEALSAAASVLRHADLTDLDHNDLDTLADITWREINLMRNSKGKNL